MRKYWHGAHTKHRLRYHLVWMPKYRKRVLKDKIAIRLRDLLYQGCSMNKWWIHEIKILSNHVHLIIQIQPTDNLARVVQILKGGSSRAMRQEFPELEEFLWGDSFWSDGYFAETVGAVSEYRIREYIREQSESMPLRPRGSGL